jgi:TolB-like protein/class 3 adenylate cyclase
MESQSHHLKAILFSDIVGYSEMMNKDEKRALEALEEARKQHKDLGDEYHGQLIKELGDGFLLSFTSVIDAVQCAKELISATTERSFKLRIGVHLGEVVDSDGDIFGEGVNIAARLQQQAKENEVLLSESVQLNIKNQPDLNTQFVGKKSLKNIEEPVNLYRLADEIGTNRIKIPRKKSLTFFGILAALIIIIFVITDFYETGGFMNQDTSIAERTIAVLPFENLSDDPDQEYFSDGVSDEIRTKLGFIKGLTVRGRSSSVYFKGKSKTIKEISNDLNVNYVLEGSARNFENKAYFNLSLVDVNKNAVILPIQIEKTLDDIFEVQAEIARMVAGELKTILLPEEKIRIEKAPTENLDAYRYYLLARYNFLQGQSRDEIDNILEYLDAAIAIDSNFAKAYALKAGVLLSLTGWGYQNVEKTINVAKPLAERALKIDPELSEAHQSMASMYTYAWNIKKAYDELQEAIRLDPENDLNYFTSWQLMMTVGEYDLALQAIMKARKLNPFNAINDAQVGMTYFNMGKIDSAIAELERNLERFPDNNHAKWVLAGCYVSLAEYNMAVKYLLDRSVKTNNLNWVLGHTYARMGKRDSARIILKYLIDMYQMNYVPPSQIALVYYGMRNEDSTYIWMEKAHRTKDWNIPRLVPLFDSLLAQPPYNEWFGGKELNDAQLSF